MCAAAYAICIAFGAVSAVDTYIHTTLVNENKTQIALCSPVLAITPHMLQLFYYIWLYPPILSVLFYVPVILKFAIKVCHSLTEMGGSFLDRVDLKLFSAKQCDGKHLSDDSGPNCPTEKSDQVDSDLHGIDSSPASHTQRHQQLCERQHGLSVAHDVPFLVVDG